VRVLLDECVPRKLPLELSGHEVRTVVEAGWSGRKNGPLLQLAAEQFDVLLTVDTTVQYQQNLARYPIAVVVMLAVSKDINVLRPLMPQVRELLSQVQPGTLYQVGSAG
jgi:hypothetical protein